MSSFSLRARIGAGLFCALLAGCPTGSDSGDESSDAGDPGTDSSTPVTPGKDASSTSVPDASKPDSSSSTVDAAPPPVPCGRLTTLCKDGETCGGPPDCSSKVCFMNKCASAAVADGVQNGDETDVDCGGSKAPACADSLGCLVPNDCTSGVCTGMPKKCQAPSPTDGVKNGDETGIDCGGALAPKCAAGQGCLSNADCDQIKCDLVAKKCLPAAHDDGIQNLDETGIDCGGPTAGVARCAPGGGCLATSDCNNTLCNAGGTCDPATNVDGLKNGNETDIDCGGGAGGTNAPACKGGKVCVADTDCSSTACNYGKKCAWSRSCRQHLGGDTCGKGEVGAAGAAQEDCCTSVALPGSTIAIDKYEITAGRMREFIAKTGGNVAGFVNANRAITSQIADNMVQYLPIDFTTPTRTITRCKDDGTSCVSTVQGFGVREHLGNNVFMPDRPCPNCGQGCWWNTPAGDNGHPTYWWDDTTQVNQFGAGKRINSQGELDVKSLNCTPQLLFAAFCAWDGGRLPTQPELGGTSGAWGPNGMPFNASANAFKDTVAGNEGGRITYPFTQNDPCTGNSCFVVPMYAAAGGGTYHPEAATVNSTNFNPFPSSPDIFAARYVFPIPANSQTNDRAYAVAPPGRMRNDFRKVGPGDDDGYYDVAANLIEVTATSSGPDDANHNAWPRVKWVGGSFEGHTPNNRSGYDLSVLTKYGKQGARCVHDL